MERHRQQLERGKLNCPVCLDILKDPVTIPCGHNFCMTCIDNHWNEDDRKGTYSCPCCRENFLLKPILVKNTTLSDLVEELKKTEDYAAPADHYAGPEDVACDACSGKKLKAVKSCLMCMVSYCQQHLQPHYNSSAFKEHKLISPSKGLKESICSHHKEVKKIFCRTDQQCICFRCSMEKHKQHKTVTVEAERAEKQKELDVCVQEVQRRIQIREEEVKVLQQEAVAIKESADEAVKDSEAFINELVTFIKEKGSVLKQQIKSQQKAEVIRVKEHQQKVEEEIAKLKIEDKELQQLSCTEDHTQFLLRYAAPANISESEDLPRLNIRPVKYFEDVQNMVTEARGKVKEILDEEYSKLSMSVKSVEILPKAEPNTRDEFLKHFCKLSLDPFSAQTNLCFSNKDRTVSEFEFIPSHDKFIGNQQALSKGSLTGRCYWEVEWKGKGVSVAVAYKNELTWLEGFGKSKNSWALHCYKRYYEFTHDNITTRISGPKTLKVGVYLDHKAGILSFYSISDTMTLLHRVQTTFTQPLYAGIWIWTSFMTITRATLSDIN